MSGNGCCGNQETYAAEIMLQLHILYCAGCCIRSVPLLYRGFTEASAGLVSQQLIQTEIPQQLLDEMPFMVPRR